MSYQVRITETAKQDLREIAFYIVERSMDNELAKRFVIELREQCNRLVEFPQGGAIPKDRILRSFDFRYIAHSSNLFVCTLTCPLFGGLDFSLSTLRDLDFYRVHFYGYILAPNFLLWTIPF